MVTEPLFLRRAYLRAFFDIINSVVSKIGAVSHATNQTARGRVW